MDSGESVMETGTDITTTSGLWIIFDMKKARFGYPPGSRKARFFLNHLAWIVFG